MSKKGRGIYQKPSVVVLEVYERLITRGDAHPLVVKRYKELLQRERKVIR